MTYASYFLIAFMIWIIMEIYRKRKTQHSYNELMYKSNNPDIRDQDKGLKKWVGIGTIIIIILFLIGSCWMYRVFSQPTPQELQIDRSHRKTIGY